MQNAKKISPARRNYQKLEDVIGCKWSVSVLHTIAAGITRPGEIERSIAGISTKVLSERFRKLTAYGLLDKQVFNEIPPRTEYTLTTSGRQLMAIIEQIQALDKALNQD